MVWAGTARAQDITCAGHLATIGADGVVSAGARTAVLEAVRRGAALRVHWSLDPNNDGVPEISHWADAGFLSEWQGEVFAQIDDIQQQAPRRDPPRIEMPIGRDRASGKEIRRIPQKAGIAWFALLSGEPSCDASPLKLAVPGGVERAKK